MGFRAKGLGVWGSGFLWMLRQEGRTDWKLGSDGCSQGFGQLGSEDIGLLTVVTGGMKVKVEGFRIQAYAYAGYVVSGIWSLRVRLVGFGN